MYHRWNTNNICILSQCFTCFLRFLQQIRTISINTIYLLVFLMTKKCAVHEVETERLYYSRKLVFNELMYIYQQEQEKT